MKKSFTFLVLLLAAVMPVSQLHAQNESKQPPSRLDACIVDGFGYQWKFEPLKVTPNGRYNGIGTVDIGGGTIWKAAILGNTNHSSVQLIGANPHPDHCTTASDSFYYNGTATATFANGIFTFSGSGNWKSYCYGGVLNNGDWSANECARGGPARSKGIATPAGHAAQIAPSVITVSPNPVINSATIHYNVTVAGMVNITVYNSMMQPVKVLVNEMKSAGKYSVTWNAGSSQVHAGTYKIVAQINNVKTTTTVVVVQ